MAANTVMHMSRWSARLAQWGVDVAMTLLNPCGTKGYRLCVSRTCTSFLPVTEPAANYRRRNTSTPEEVDLCHCHCCRLGRSLAHALSLVWFYKVFLCPSPSLAS